MSDKEVSLSGATPPDPNQGRKPGPTGATGIPGVGSNPNNPAAAAATAAAPPPKTLKADASKADVIDFLISQSQDQLIPWNDAFLPSLGKYYNGQIPGGTVKIKAMSISSEKVLATARLVQSGQSLDEVFKRCVRFPDANFDSQELLVGDRAFLLFVLRGLTHGNMYEFTIKCGNEDCGINITSSYDLNEINNTIKHPKHETEPVNIRLPYYSEKAGRDVTVDVRFMRGRDMVVINKRKKQLDRVLGQHAHGKDQAGGERQLPSVTLDQSIEENLNLLIISANGVTDRGKISRFVANMHARDSATIREIIRDEAPGIDAEINVVCPSCGNDMRLELPITETFFRPKNLR